MAAVLPKDAWRTGVNMIVARYLNDIRLAVLRIAAVRLGTNAQRSDVAHRKAAIDAVLGGNCGRVEVTATMVETETEADDG